MSVAKGPEAVRLRVHLALPAKLADLERAAATVRDFYGDASMELDWSLEGQELVLSASPEGWTETAHAFLERRP